MKEKTRKEMSRHTDGWLISNPDRVSILIAPPSSFILCHYINFSASIVYKN